MIKRVLLLITTMIIIFLLCYYNNKKDNNVDYIIKTENSASIEELYIYGNHLNINGYLNYDEDIDSIKLLFNGKEKLETDLKYNLEKGKVNFYLSKEINNGYLLDNINKGEYNLYIQINNKEIFNLKNKTKYSKTKYYPIKNDEQKVMLFTNKNDTINLDVNSDNEAEVFDIIIDPGHGGKDEGACANGYCEIDFTYKIANLVKNKLEENGLKVKLSRDENQTINNYGKDGRVNNINKSFAKFIFSIHLNSNDYNDSGVEIYTPYNVEYTLAKNLATNISEIATTHISTNNFFKVYDGVYTRTLLNSDLEELAENAKKNGYEKYNVSNNTTYYFMIRETGGFMSGAYRDGRDGEPYNFEFDSNVGREGYLLELGYITDKNDLNNIVNNYEKYAEAISKTITEYIRK